MNLVPVSAELTWPTIYLLNYDSKGKLDRCPDNIEKLQCTGPVINMPAIIEPLLGQDSFYSFFPLGCFTASLWADSKRWGLHNNTALISVMLLEEISKKPISHETQLSWHVAIWELPGVMRKSLTYQGCSSRLGQTTRNSTRKAI